jgi:hypothetical protein
MVFCLDALQVSLGLKPNTLRREARLRRLRVAKRAGKLFVLGAWVLQWLEAGEVRREQAAAQRNGFRGGADEK